MTELSIGELDSLILKAYRGAGFSWGMAQEAGRAAGWMALRGLPAADCFAELLQHTDGLGHSVLTPAIDTASRSGISKDASEGPVCCPVIAGTVLSDFGTTGSGESSTVCVYSPLILIPFVSACAESAGTALSISTVTGESSIYLSADGQLVAGENDFATSATTVLVSESTEAGTGFVAPTARRAAVSEVVLKQLETLAHRTYVPASELSRSGAGAGLTDND